MFLSLLFLLLLCPATGSTPPVTVLSQLSNLLYPCLSVSVCVCECGKWQPLHASCKNQRTEPMSVSVQVPDLRLYHTQANVQLGFFWGSSVAANARRRDAGACIINNEMIWTLTLAKSLSQVRNGVEVETRESQRVAAATGRLTQLFQLSDCCWCCCCCFCCIYCRMVGLMSVCPFVCLSVCLSGLVLRLSWSPLMIYAGARLPLPACLAGWLAASVRHLQK